MRLLDRYVIRNFLQIYFYCIAGFISIWLIFDVSDNISTFIDQHVPLSLVIRYYGTQLPQVFIILLPVSLLLSLLFALGRMSRANEIVSMLTVQNFLPRSNTFNNVQVLQQDANDNIVTNYVASRATYRPETKNWDLENVKVVHYDHAGNIVDEQIYPSLKIEHWSETPFRLGSANQRAEFLSLPELREYLRFNADFPATLLAPFRTHLQYRLALPWTCLVVVCIAAPLGIGYSRQGVLSSVAAAVILVFTMNFLVHLFLALGEGYRVPAWIAAWAPNILFMAVGLYLLYLRASNREPVSFHLFTARRIVAR